MIQLQIPQNDMWDVVIQGVGLLASMASLALAVVAIWLSFKFYTMSVRSSEKIEEANRAISASVDRLEKVFQMQYSDTFSMVRDTYTDFRKHLMPETTAVARAEQLAESAADQKVEQLRTEIGAELTKIVNRVGQTDGQLGSVKTQLEGVIEKAIDRSRKVDQEAVKETLEASIISYIENIPLGDKRTAANVFADAHSRGYSPADVARILFDLSKRGKIKFDREIDHWFMINPSDSFEPTL